MLTVVDRTTRWVDAFPMPEATSLSCATAFIRGWIAKFGTPNNAACDNGNTFISELWADVNKALNIDVKFTPPYHPSSLGGVERKHRDIKLGLKATLRQLGDTDGTRWMDRLPWVLLARNTAFQPDLGASAAELVMGSNPHLPGDMPLVTDPVLTNPQLEELLSGLRANAARPPVPTSSHRQQNVNMPDILDNITHVRLRKGKTKPLGPAFDGPYKIISREGSSCLKLLVGHTAAGVPRHEIHHLDNCRPALDLQPSTVPKAQRGRKKVTLATNADEVTEPSITNAEDLQNDAPVTTTRAGRTSRPPERYGF